MQCIKRWITEAKEELRKLRESTGMNREEFCEYFEIPGRFYVSLVSRRGRIREGDPLHTTLTPIDRFCINFIKIDSNSLCYQL